MKKLVKIIFLTFIMGILLSFTAYADMGSKPRVKISITNPPKENYYLDLLYKPSQSESVYKNLEDVCDPKMLDLLFSYTDEGLYPAFAHGTPSPMWGSLLPNENGNHIFSYVGVPDEFKIIIVTESGEVKVSDIIKRNTMEISLNLNYDDMSYTTRPVWKAYLCQLAVTLPFTIIIEFLILILFGFKLKPNFKPFLTINIVTQIILSLSLSASFIYGGSLGITFAFIPLEIAVTLIECLYYKNHLVGKNVLRNLIYGITANLATALLTFVNIDKLIDFLFTLIR